MTFICQLMQMAAFWIHLKQTKLDPPPLRQLPVAISARGLRGQAELRATKLELGQLDAPLRMQMSTRPTCARNKTIRLGPIGSGPLSAEGLHLSRARPG